MNLVDRETLEVCAGRLVDSHTGLIRILKEVPPDVASPRFFHYYAQACNTSAFWPFENFGATGGAGVDRWQTMAKAMGEAVERYCAAAYSPERATLATFESHRRGPSPSDYSLYSRDQLEQSGFPWKPFSDDTPTRWVEGFDVGSGESALVPAAMVFVPYMYDRSVGELPFAQPISTGLSCHTSRARAMIGAICEIIERDAFTIVWQRECGVRHVALSSLSRANADIVARFARIGSQVTLCDITLDHGVTTILGLLTSDSNDEPALVAAGSASPDPHDAVRKCLEELAHTRRYSVQIKRRDKPKSLNDGDVVADQRAHLNVYCQKANLQAAQFLLESNGDEMSCEQLGRIDGSHDEDTLAQLVRRVEQTGHRVIEVDLTTEDVASVGLFVVRALIPGYHPLFLGHINRADGGNRLWRIPEQLGMRCRSRTRGCNPAPHPYP